MPATEQTWRDQKLLHVVFAVTGLLMLLSTVWMFAADHRREWKQHQRTIRGVEGRSTQWRLAQEQASANWAEHERISGELLQAKGEALPAGLLSQFQDEVQRDAQQRGIAAYDFTAIDRLNATVGELAQAAAEKRAAARKAAQQREEAEQAYVAVLQEVDAAQAGPRAAREVAESKQAAAEQVVAAARAAAQAAEQDALAAEAAAAAKRGQLLGRLHAIVRAARFREDSALGERKFKAADFDAARATLGLAIRDGRSADPVQKEVDVIKQQLDRLTLAYQHSAAHRNRLQDLSQQMTSREQQLRKELEANQEEAARLADALQERQATYFTSAAPFLGKKWLELPILDAFNSPLKIDNLWTKNLTIANGSFGQVRRFDRCTTCHRLIAKTAAGSAVDPAYPAARELVLLLQTPASRPQGQRDEAGRLVEPTLESVYGIQVAEAGLVNPDEVTVRHVAPGSAAALAQVQAEDTTPGLVADGFRVGDVIRLVNQDKVLSGDQLGQFLLETATWGRPLRLTVRRGLPQPYTAHPRLDLFVGSLSPHPLATMACTVCHEGQGSATTFKWASHTPNDLAQEAAWARDLGWFNNHHWIYPMFPQRFAESACLKCHHEVTELKPSNRFPDPPAPKLTAGFELVRDYGCYGCHEINGYAGKDRRLGPDLRLEPNYSAAAQAIAADPGFDRLDALQQQWVRELIQHPWQDEVRHRLSEFLQLDADAEAPTLQPATARKMVDVLKDVEIPGRLRKVGPSLRHVGVKLDAAFLYDWIREPGNFRPSTRMPRFFGLWDHLQGQERKLAERYEPIEILGIVTYLLDRSQPYSPGDSPRAIAPSSPDAQVARGKLLFETRGCLACHAHVDFPAASSTFGPELSSLGDKFRGSDGLDAQQWLSSWLRDPTRYSPRTRMPNLYLEPIVQPDGTATDPAEDISAYLLSGSRGWQPPADTRVRLSSEDEVALDELALEHLKSAFFIDDAHSYLEHGIPAELGSGLKGGEIELVGSADQRRKLLYVGSKTIVKYGCHGCHDIPGFEDAKPIGTAIADWGRKDPARLAFEHISHYVEEHPAHGPAVDAGDHQGEGSLDESFYHGRLADHDRVGFLWQKLKEPRSYDYQANANKSYNERLRMPRFPFDPHAREAVMTFVLGLVAEPPATEFVYQPSPRREAENVGVRVLEDFNCTGCHILEGERWQIEFQPGEIRPQPEVATYPFLSTHVSPERLAASQEADVYRGRLSATLHGMPAVDDTTGRPLVLDEEGDPIEEGVTYDPATLQYPLELWEPAVLNGQVYEVGVLPLSIFGSMIRQKYPAQGGDLVRLLYTRAVELARADNPNAKATEAWGWLPPPLLGEGNKVQTEWLYSFLRDPHPIRPAVLMRMPRFNLAPDDATALANYFAARSDAAYPYEFDPRTTAGHLAAAEANYRQALTQVPSGERPPGPGRLDHAMRIVVDSNYCVKCHLLGDFQPEGSNLAKAPNLAEVHRRLRPDWVRNWIANPKRYLPYTPMPVNIPYDPQAPHLGGVSQQLFHGTSVEQLDGLVDLLMNFSVFTERGVSFQSLVGTSPGGGETGPPADREESDPN